MEPRKCALFQGETPVARAVKEHLSVAFENCLSAGMASCLALSGFPTKPSVTVGRKR